MKLSIRGQEMEKHHKDCPSEGASVEGWRGGGACYMGMGVESVRERGRGRGLM